MKSFVGWYPIFIMVAIDFAFAISNILLKKIILDGMNPLVFITYRQAISTIFLAPVAFFLEKNNRPKLTPQILCSLFLSAIVGASLTQYLFLLGMEYTSATFSCAFLNMVPVITFLMALPFGLETINIKHGSGIAKAFGTLICVGGSGMCYVGMSWCVKKRGPVFTAAFSPLVQVMAAMFDVPILHEQLHLGSVIGSAIVIAGLYFLLWGKNRGMQKVVHETEEKKEKELPIKDLETNSESRIP
ncbi:WAT1-related protein [Capsicum annuum]|nr:WAT1-related protein [Capsicum annuum]